MLPEEADVYLGLWKQVPLALKVYRLHHTPHKKREALGYAPDRIGLIAANEFTMLEKACRAGIPVPTPARRVDNMFTMRFLGDEASARLLKDLELEDPEYFAAQALELISKLLEAFIVHGDLSEYNLLLHQGRIFVIDFPQAIDLSSRVNRHSKFETAKPFLCRDLENVAHYFGCYDVEIDARKELELLTNNFEKTYL